MPTRNQGQSKRGAGFHATGVQKSGSYGSATLSTPGTPIDMNRSNSTPKGKIASNGVTPNSPTGDVTFCAKDGAVEHFNARPLVGEAKRNLSASTNAKTRSEKDTASFRQGKGNTGTSAAGAPIAVGLKYGKGGAHGKQGRSVRLG